MSTATNSDTEEDPKRSARSLSTTHALPVVCPARSSREYSGTGEMDVRVPSSSPRDVLAGIIGPIACAEALSPCLALGPSKRTPCSISYCLARRARWRAACKIRSATEHEHETERTHFFGLIASLWDPLTLDMSSVHIYAGVLLTELPATPLWDSLTGSFPALLDPSPVACG